MVVQFKVGDVVRLKKPHPCGSYTWQVTRVGADVGLRCQTCDHRVMLDRAYLERRMKGLPVSPEGPGSASEGAST